MIQPSLFVSHGAPTFALEASASAQALNALAKRLSRPRAILIISAHWLTTDLQVGHHPQPPTVHDFWGFPESLYTLRYPAPGAPEIADEVLACLADAGIAANANAGRGLDHGAWVPLMRLYPDAKVPVLPLSLPASTTPAELLAIGRALQPLRATGVLVIGSGGITHNLGDLRSDGSPVPVYVTEFMGWIAAMIAAGDLDALTDYRSRAPGAARAHPSAEHLLPLFVAIGAAGAAWQASSRLLGGVSYGVIGMDHYLFGLPPDWAENETEETKTTPLHPPQGVPA